MLADRVLETSTTTGTGNFTVTGAVAGFQTIGAAFTVGDEFSYAIEAVDASGNPTGEYENGGAIVLTSSTFERYIVNTSSNAGALVNFSAGTKYVYVTWDTDDIMTMGRIASQAAGLAIP